MTLPRRLALPMIMVLVAACGGTPSSPSVPSVGSPGTSAGSAGDLPVWTRPADPMGLATRAGLTPDRKEYVDFHIHAHLDVFVDGRPVKVPGGIGIETTDPSVVQFSEDNFAGIPEEGCATICISPLHTHDADGVIHMEAPTETPFTLGQFFEELAVPLDASCVDEFCTPDTDVAVYVNGDLQSGNPADIPLTDLQQVSIVIGTPPAEIPDSFSGEP